jgi:carbohydrate-binding DOMON domain-containing protein
MKIKIISIERNKLGGKNLIEVIWKYKKIQKVNYIITDEDFSNEYITNYLENINYESKEM